MHNSLDKKLRKQLENTIVTARNVAEIAARTALERLCVGSEPGEHLTDDMRKQRNKLRAHGRQIGDVLKGKTEQTIEHLVHETAYEQWHRMLFARFLAENHLLIYKEDGETPLSIQECFELAEDEDNLSGWDLAGQYASVMLPQIFRTENPVLTISFSPEHQHELEQLLEALHVDTFQAQDSLGWVYQYWQTQKKEEVNKSGNKIGADELPAVTQLFTEPYMVNFLLDNSLGAWWVSNYPQYKDILPFTYLRYAPEQIDDEDAEYKETDIPAAGTFDQWPKQLSKLKMLDPCCGSGHFLVSTLLMLVPMRMNAEGLTVDEAIEKVLSQNIHGLELDQRCVEIAAFAVALEAWRYPESSGYRQLPSLNIAWVGQSIKAKKEDWLLLAGDDECLYHGMDALYDAFKDAPVLGSLIDPSKVVTEDLLSNGFSELQPLLNKALQQFEVAENKEATIAAKGLTLAADLLSNKYELVVTNVPYLSLGKQCDYLKDFVSMNYSNAKPDLATVFIKRCIELCNSSGISITVSPHNWCYLASYKKFRSEILNNSEIVLVISLGNKAFTTPMWDFGISLNFISKKYSKFNDTKLVSLEQNTKHEEIRTNLQEHKIESIKQLDLLSSNSSRIMLVTKNQELLSNYCTTFKGLCLGDSGRFSMSYWEVSYTDNTWILMQGSYSSTTLFDGCDLAVKWQDRAGDYLAYVSERLGDSISAWVRGVDAWNKSGITIRVMGNLPAVLYLGTPYNNNVSTIIPKDKEHLPAIWLYCSSPQFNKDVRKLNAKPSITDDSFLSVPFDFKYWNDTAQQKYPNGLPKPYSDNPGQWIFHGHPAQSESPLQVAIARLLGYRWPAESDKDMELSEQTRDWIQKCEVLSSYVDDDGIVCLPPIRGEKSAEQRLVALLMAAYSQEWNTTLRNKLLTEVKCKGKSLESWLREKFFEQHCKLFQNRPFIWQIWDGLPDGFSALVNYHQLDRQNLERLIYTYLGDWIRTQEHGVKEGIDGATIKLQAAQTLKFHLEAILEGEGTKEKPYDIFVRWKSLQEQSIGWNPDINDGVRMNIRPFMSVPDIGKKKDAGILRSKPNIHWKKDRGKDVESAPWYKLGLKYGESVGSRINDHHLSLAEKEAARNE